MESKLPCPYCKEEVSSEATKCPFCREWLNKTKLSLRNPYVQLFIILSIFLAGSNILKYFFVTKFVEKNETLFKDWVTYSEKSKLKILNSRLVKNKNSFRILGEIENTETFKWDSIEIVATFKDKDGLYYLATSFVRNLRPGERRSFQTSEPCSNVSEKLPDTYEIKIETASARL